MKYRKFGKLNWEVSALSFGSDALPVNNAGETGDIIRQAVDLGVNYIDLGFPESDHFEQTALLIHNALENGYRQRVRIAAHIPVSRLHHAKDLDIWLNRQLKCLQEDRVDFLILDGVDRYNWPRLLEMNVLNRAEAALTDDRIDGLGFSYRDHLQHLRKIIEDYDYWTLCQIQYSYMDVDRHPGLSVIRYAAGKGLAVIVTEPLRGGRLTQEPPAEVAAIWAGAGTARSLAEWGLHWVLNHPEIATVICDMNTREQVEENTSLAAGMEPGSLSIREQLLISQVRDAYRKLKPVPCAACRVCMPCPQDIDVPRILELYNEAIMFEDVEAARKLYEKEQHHLEDCNECGACVDACGRMIAILDWLEEARTILEDKSDGIGAD